MTTAASSTIIHGPTKTRSFGIAMIFDVMAPQTNLVVERGSLLPRASVIVTSAARRIIEHSKAGDKVEAIVVVGSEDNPTKHPDIKEITENLRTLRGKWFPRAKMYMVSDTPDLQTSPALHMYNTLLQTFEWGSTKTFSALTGMKGTELAVLTKRLGGYENLVLAARFFRGDLDNSTDAELKGWIKRALEISPREVQVLTGSPPTHKKSLKTVTKTREQKIVDEIGEKTGLSVTTRDYEALLG